MSLAPPHIHRTAEFLAQRLGTLPLIPRSR